jgi:hypothetical protein
MACTTTASSPKQTSQVLRIARGADVMITATFDADDDTPSIAGWGIEFAVAPTLGALPTFSRTVGDGITIVDPVARVITIEFGFSFTDPLQIRTYVFDIWRTDTAERDRLARGTMPVEERVVALT